MRGNQQSDSFESLLTQADIFAEIFRRETIRFKYGSKNQLREASTRLRGCLDKIDALMEGTCTPEH
jgi:hypothetical protein